jgi:hypothetical protein
MITKPVRLVLSMKKQDVPQDQAILEQWHEMSYATDEEGRYVLAPCAGWEPANIANQQAWEVIGEQVRQVEDRVRAGKLSPLAYFMVRNQMEVKLLAKYVGLPGWQVKRHLKPAVFKKLKVSTLVEYAKVFGVTVHQLTHLAEGEETP